MIIAFVSDAIYPYNKGGKEKRLYEISTRLAKMNHEVHIYCMKWWEGPKDRIEDGVHLHAIGKLHPLYIGQRRSIKEGVFFGLACLKLLTKKFDVIDVDHMPFFPLYSVWLVCALRGKKMYASWHEVWGRQYWLSYMSHLGHLSAYIERFSIHLPAKIISVSEHTTKRVLDDLHYNKAIVTIPNGLDYERISGVKVSDKASDILFVGRLLGQKNVDMLLRSIAQLKERGTMAHCIIVGNGPEKVKLEALSQELGLTKLVEFHDFYDDQDDIYSLMKATKVFAYPSTREGFGMAAIEAHATGTPVVTTTASDNAAQHLIKHGVNGFLFEPQVNALTEVLEEALQKFKGLEKDCIKSAKRFDWENITKQVSEAYAQ
jgi:glycosyltransferase involved in cell wall biosynthesis